MKDIEIEIAVCSQFRDSAVELGLQATAVLLTEQIEDRKQALSKQKPQSAKPKQG